MEYPGSIGIATLEIPCSQWDLSTTLGQIDRIDRHGESTESCSQLPFQREAMFQRYPKVSGSTHKIPLKEVVGFDPVRDQQIHELLKGSDIVVHSPQQHRLVHHRKTCIDKQGYGLSARGGDFTRMVELGHDKKSCFRICLQHGCQLSGNPVG